MHINIYFLWISAQHFPYATSYLPKTSSTKKTQTNVCYSKRHSLKIHFIPLSQMTSIYKVKKLKFRHSILPVQSRKKTLLQNHFTSIYTHTHSPPSPPQKVLIFA